MKVLVTGGAGYIGSTVASACKDAGHDVVILDDFFTGRREFIDERPLHEGDIAGDSLLNRLFGEQRIDAVVHCAAEIIIPGSVSEPLAYHENSIAKTIALLATLQRNGMERLLSGSSTSIYAPGENFVATEDSPLQPGPPCARTKFMVELILEDFTRASDVQVASLRYFNPIGTDPKLRSGQQLKKSSHVLAKFLGAWVNKGTFIVTGVGWPARGSSGIRNFIHVWDLARAHVAALEHFDETTTTDPCQVLNTGTGNGVAVKELAASFEKITGDLLKTRFGDPRPGDVAGVYTVSTKARDVFGWETELTGTDAVRDAIAWLSVRKERLGY